METCVILAGGKSSRMGRDKTLLPFGGFATLAHYEAHKFAQIFKRVFVSAKFSKFNPPLPLIKDAEDTSQPNLSAETFSPMLALYSVLRNFKDESVFIAPADMPFISEECVRELYKFSGEYDMVVAADESHTHSLCGFFSADLASKAGELFAAGEHKIGLLRDRCRCKIVNFKDEKQFFNINSPSDYEEALMI